MKRVFNWLTGLQILGLMLFMYPNQTAQAQPGVTVSYQSFYDELSPYGQWVSDPQYGNVWVPSEGGDFRPYGSRGHWAMTDYGNTWVSSDPWGWACYHYGRWTYNSYYGWVWIPGQEWAPAWVDWRYGGGQCGWAPLGPGATVGVSWGCPESWWVFVGPQYMYRDNCVSYWRGPSYNHTYINNTTIINNTYIDNGTHVRYNYGPRADVIQRDTHQPVQVYKLSSTNRPGASNVGGRTVSMYRPAINRSTVSSARPSNVINAPKAIGRPQAQTTIAANRQPAFRQVVQQKNPANTGVVGPHNQPNTQRPGAPQNNNHPATQPNTNRPQTQTQHTQPGNNNRPQTQPQHAQPGNNNRPQPQPQHTQQPANNRPQNQQQPQHAQQNQNRPQPQPQPQMNQPRQQPAQQHQQPQMQQQRPQPQMQQQRPMAQPHQEAPRQEAPHEEPRGEGGRR